MLLERTLEAVDTHGTFSSSQSDLLKNTLLAKVRFLQALQAEVFKLSNAHSTDRPSSVVHASQSEKLYAEMMSIKDQCLVLIPRFLLEAIDDKDAEAFGKVYIKLREASYM